MRYILFLIVVGLTFNLNLLTAQEGLNNPKQKEECQLVTQFETIQISCNEFEFEPIVGLVVGFVIVNYHWDFGDGVTSLEQNPIHEFTEDGNYLVELTITMVSTETGECCNSSQLTKVVINCGGRMQASSVESRQSNPLSSLSISPNPTSSTVTIKFIPIRYVTDIVYITIASLDGKALKKLELKDNYQTTIDVSDLPNGTYSVSAIYNNQIFGAEKLVIQK